jgi:hypothetical protein
MNGIKDIHEKFQKAWNENPTEDNPNIGGSVGLRTWQSMRSVDAPRFPPSRPGDGSKALVLA